MMLVDRQNVVVVGGSSGIEYAVDARATSHELARHVDGLETGTSCLRVIYL